MDEWTDIIYPELLTIVSMDENYQNRLEQCQKAEDAYLAIVNTLSDEQRDIIDNYITMCEELEYRMTQLAYYLGKTQ